VIVPILCCSLVHEMERKKKKKSVEHFPTRRNYYVCNRFFVFFLQILGQSTLNFGEGKKSVELSPSGWGEWVNQRCSTDLPLIPGYTYTPVRKVFAEGQVLWRCLGGNESTSTTFSVQSILKSLY